MNNVRFWDNHIYFVNMTDFEPKKIFENGQTFRWQENQGLYTFVAGPYLASLKTLDTAEKNQLVFQNVITTAEVDSPVVALLNGGTQQDYTNFWHGYFDMERDYENLRHNLAAVDQHLATAMEYGKGMRILNQEFFEVIISFILSANNNIKRIQQGISKITELAGDKMDSAAGVYYKFPTPAQVAAMSIEDLTQIAKVGYRALYIVKAAQMIANQEVDLEEISAMDYEAAHKELLRLPGVGPKVADCILLFGNGREMAFPVDTWVIKVMNLYYLGNEKNSKKIKADGLQRFGQLAGIAQQYLFYHAREHKIGSKENVAKPEDSVAPKAKKDKVNAIAKTKPKA